MKVVRLNKMLLYSNTVTTVTEAAWKNKAVRVAITRNDISISSSHRHRIDKYLDTLLANQPISDGEATDHCQKGALQDGRLPELIVAQSCLTNHSEASRPWLVTPKQEVVGNHQWRHWRVVCCNVEDLNFGMQNLRPSNIKVIFQRPCCGSPYSGDFRFHCRYCLCGSSILAQLTVVQQTHRPCCNRNTSPHLML